MPENEKIEVNKVEIADVHEAGEELTEAEQGKVAGGGGGPYADFDGS